jgi:cytoskeletal protein CcmA (bactofilin family)
MALWKEPAAPAPSPIGIARPPADAPARPAPERIPEPAPAPAGASAAARPKERTEARESLIAAGLAIEGKIQGTGNVRIAGAFKGDVLVEGNLSIEPGAKHQGEVRAGTVTVSGELTGNIGARHVDVTPTGVIVGDVKAETITVASGSRMRGHVEFGWGDASTHARGDSTISRIEPKGSGLPS